MAMEGIDPRIADLVRSQEIRLALFLPQYAKDAQSGELRGLGIGFVAIEFARALAAPLGIAVRVVEHPTPPLALRSLKNGACDLAMIGIEPSRTAEFDFTPPIVQFDYTVLVPGGSTLRTCAEIDRPALKIVVVRNHASTLALSRLVKRAELVGTELPDTAFDMLRSGNADAFAAPREVLLDYCAQMPGARVLDDRYGVNNVGVAIAPGQPGRLAYLSAFAEQAKASGLIGQIIERGGLRGFRVAPRAS